MNTNDFYVWANDHVADFATLGQAILAFNDEMKNEYIPTDAVKLREFIHSRQKLGTGLEAGKTYYNLEELQYMFERVQFANGNNYKEAK